MRKRRRQHEQVPSPMAEQDKIVRSSDPDDFVYAAYAGSTKRYVAVCHWCGKEGDLHVLYGREVLSCGCNADAEKAARLDHLAARRAWGQALPRFKEHAPCPKCGNKFRTSVFEDQTRGSLYAPYFQFERIHRTCGVCGWQCDELPLDYDPGTL